MTNEEFQQIVLSEMKEIHQRFDALESRADHIDRQLGVLAAQQDENADYGKALLHQVEALTAKYDALFAITVDKDAFAKVAAKIDIMNHRILLRTAWIKPSK